MTRAEIELKVKQALWSVAPELESTPLDPRLPLRDQVDIDSMDFLRFVMDLHRQFNIDVPEADYQKLDSLDRTVEYIVAKAGAQR
jgi:acyl carrier protein